MPRDVGKILLPQFIMCKKNLDISCQLFFLKGKKEKIQLCVSLFSSLYLAVHRGIESVSVGTHHLYLLFCSTILTPSTKVELFLIIRSSGEGHRRHMMQNESLDEHPQEHGRLAVFDQGVKGLTEIRLQMV